MTTPVPPTVTTIAQAFKILGLGHSISSNEEVILAFRRRVKSAARGGDFAGDMDNLTQAKELLLTALARVREEAEKAETRRRAKEAEQTPKRKKEPPKSVPPLCLGAAKSNPYEAIRAYERKKALEREESRRLFERQRLHKGAKQDKPMKVQEQKGQRPAPQVGDDLIQGALSLLESRRLELEQIRQREQEMSQELSRTQARRTELEQAVQKAGALAEQMIAILEAVAQ